MNKKNIECPYCCEEISADTVKCPYCSSTIRAKSAQSDWSRDIPKKNNS